MFNSGLTNLQTHQPAIELFSAYDSVSLFYNIFEEFVKIPNNFFASQPIKLSSPEMQILPLCLAINISLGKDGRQYRNTVQKHCTGIKNALCPTQILSPLIRANKYVQSIPSVPYRTPQQIIHARLDQTPATAPDTYESWMFLPADDTPPLAQRSTWVPHKSNHRIAK